MIRWIVGGSLLGLVLAWPLRPQAQDVSTGAALFGERCAVCHGGDARGAIGPSLVTLWASGAIDGGIALPGMPCRMVRRTRSSVAPDAQSVTSDGPMAPRASPP